MTERGVIVGIFAVVFIAFCVVMTVTERIDCRPEGEALIADCIHWAGVKHEVGCRRAVAREHPSWCLTR